MEGFLTPVHYRLRVMETDVWLVPKRLKDLDHPRHTVEVTAILKTKGKKLMKNCQFGWLGV
jgi:hypothetical protein